MHTISTSNGDIIGNSRALRSVLQDIQLVGPTDSTVLIQGETGTGKELMARAIHRASARRNAPLVALNCAAIPASLLESELFGHERGAFTGAVSQRIGRFEMANGGTLFLDEIGEIAPDVQVKLLRVLQEQEFERLGSTRTTRVNVRVVAATNRDLWRMVEQKEFRGDLFYRLNVFPLRLPSLRDRREDIPTLARHFMTIYAERMRKPLEEISSETIDAMVAYDWPGNVRELQNFVEHAVIVSEGHSLNAPLQEMQREQSSPRFAPKTLDDATREHILQTLRETRGVVGGSKGAAAALGIARTTLLAKMRRLGIAITSSPAYSEEANRSRAFATVA
jgi:formate hydrogenlyase transcriptional activator